MVLPETRAEVALPLIIQNSVLGVLDVQSNRVNAFDDTDMLVLHALADHIAIAIENARLYGDLQKRADQLATIAGVSNAITSLLDLDELMEEVVPWVPYLWIRVITVIGPAVTGWDYDQFAGTTAFSKLAVDPALQR